MAKHFKYLIIGAGMMGAAAARHLSQWTDGVALLGPAEPTDPKTHEGVFASHYDEARITRTIDPDPVWACLAHRSIARYPEIAADSGVDFYSEAGCLLVGPKRAGGPSYVRDVLDAADRLGVQPEALDGSALATKCSCFTFPQGSEGVWEATNAGHINPRRLVKAQIVLAERQGCALLRETAASVRDDGSRAVVTTAEGNVYSADRVLVAAGGFSINEALLPRRLALDVFARTIAFYEVDESAMQVWGRVPSLIWKWNEAEDGIYLLPPVRYPDGRLYLKIGGDPDDVLIEQEPDIRAWFRSGGRESTHRHLTSVMSRLMPELDLSRTHMAACVTSFTPTGYPAISMSDSDRIGVLSGGCGAAAKSSDEIGRLGAELIFHGAVLDDAYSADFRARFV
ncbi:FAD-dependent oxidoreductase [Pseudorhizobium pelagicum]|uniref:FAD-dependent oxidoreductase n=1 Tax=Pseudorhizobium pelagicum TaxID=1509405 RepID=A0A922P3E7_9HYPH|nr:FAD-dependent oxidoreductase [Pseudorhizobium pelagicum]KEQ05044.1 FAD-dependent oxidoreductase [Pseudorhizobium pelagicum]KEQ07557.1 FAD-dependent oxidoreductase [Pseudorhizobium pelagicum]